MDITVVSYNCCSLRKNIDVIRELADRRIDIIFLQETFLTEEKLGELDFIDGNYESVWVGGNVLREESCICGLVDQRVAWHACGGAAQDLV